jgi:hypothetical protein
MLLGLPILTRNAMLDVCLKLRLWMASAERADLDHLPGIFSQSKSAYLELMVQAYGSLETLRIVFSALQTIVPFLSNRQPRFGEDHQREVLDFQRTSAEDTATSISSTAPPIEKRPSIRFIYVVCLQALRAATIKITNKDPATQIYSRLIDWGCSLFYTSTSLDLI